MNSLTLNEKTFKEIERIALIYCRGKKDRQHPDFFIRAAISGNALDNKHLPYGLPARVAPLTLKNSFVGFVAATLPIIPYGSLLL
jgi:hypothetical protein